MRLEYRVRYFDYLLFNVVQQFLSPLMQSLYVMLFALVVWGETTSKQPITSALATASIYYVVMWLATIVLLALFLFTRRADSVLTDHVLEVRDDALYERTRFNESRHFWPGVVKIVRRPGFVAVYVSQRTAHVIPARAFQSKEQLRQFVALIKEKKRAG